MAFKETILISSRGKTCDGKRLRHILELRAAIRKKEEESSGLSIQDLTDILLRLNDES